MPIAPMRSAPPLGAELSRAELLRLLAHPAERTNLGNPNMSPGALQTYILRGVFDFLGTNRDVFPAELGMNICWDALEDMRSALDGMQRRLGGVRVQYIAALERERQRSEKKWKKLALEALNQTPWREPGYTMIGYNEGLLVYHEPRTLFDREVGKEEVYHIQHMVDQAYIIRSWPTMREFQHEKEFEINILARIGNLVGCTRTMLMGIRLSPDLMYWRHAPNYNAAPLHGFARRFSKRGQMFWRVRFAKPREGEYFPFAKLVHVLLSAR